MFTNAASQLSDNFKDFATTNAGTSVLATHSLHTAIANFSMNSGKYYSTMSSSTPTNMVL